MESIFALISGLTQQTSSLYDAEHRMKRLKLVGHDMYQALLFSISGIKNDINTRAELVGGGVFNVENTLSNVKAIAKRNNNLIGWEDAVLTGLYEVQGAWPYIRANIDLMLEACQAAVDQAEVARKLSLPLLPQLQAAQSSGMYDRVDKIGVSAFNSDMAQLDARIITLRCTCTEMMRDMNDALDIFSGLRDVVIKSKGALTEKVSSSLDTVLSSAASMSQLVGEITNLMFNSGGAPLIHPEVIGLDSNQSLFTSTSNLLKLKQKMMRN